MQTRYKFLTGIIILTLGVIIFHLCTWEYLEFRNAALRDSYLYCSLAFYGIAAIVCYYLITNKLLKDLIASTGAIALIIAIFFFALYILFDGVWEDDINDDRILWVNKKNKNIVVRERYTYYGLLGNGTDIDTIVTQELSENIRWAKPFKPEDINPSEWELQR